MQVGTGATKAMLGYNSFSSGSTEIKAPLVMANNSGFFTGIQVMNVGSAPTDVTITYGANTQGSLAPTPETCTALAVGQSCTQAPTRWTVDLHLCGRGDHHQFRCAKFSGHRQPAELWSARVPRMKGLTLPPLRPVWSRLWSWPTTPGSLPAIQVQNVGTGNCDIAVNYGPNTAGAFVPANETFAGLTPGSSHTFLQTGASWPATYVGSATIIGTGATCKVASIVNELAFGAGDLFMTYQALAAN